MTLYDKNRRPILVGDIIKIFHFIGGRKKKYFMYKYVYNKYTNSNGAVYYTLLHLGSDPAKLLTEKYFMLDEDGKILEDTEIVQGIRTINGTLEDVEDRKKLKKEE